MIYITKQSNGYIKVSDNEKDCEKSVEVLYRVNLDLENLYKDLRPVVVLSLGNGWYKDQGYIDSYFTGSLTPGTLDYAYGVDIDNFLTKFNKNLNILRTLGHIETSTLDLKNREKIIYKCDILNALDDTYGKNIVSMVLEFSKVDDKTREFLCTLNNRSLDYFKKSIPELLTKGDDVIKFLPEYYKIYYKTFKLGEPKVKTYSIPEYRNPEVLGEIENLLGLEEFIYSRFDLGKVYSGSEIKAELQEIYSDLGIKKTAKIVDIFDYFEVVKVNLNRESSYRLERRKIL
jgi:hypothetical protein